MSTVAILDYDAGNLTSVLRAVKHLGREGIVTRDPSRIRNAERIIFPGVGAAGAAMASLEKYRLARALHESFREGKPILGICVACQIIFDRSEEDGGTPCLGLLAGDVRRFRFPPGQSCKIPHMGWNAIELVEPPGRRHPVFAGLESGQEFYFVHSYHPVPSEATAVLATCEYGGVRFAAAVSRGPLVAVQFHPEKSGRFGLRILENFMSWRP